MVYIVNSQERISGRVIHTHISTYVSGIYAADLGMEEPVKATATSETLSILDTQPYVVHRTIAPKQKIKTLKVICCIQFTSQVVTH